MPDYVLSIDQGTTSSRAIVFDHDANIVATGQREHAQIFPRAGWVEHDPIEIWNNVREVVGLALTRANLTSEDRRVGSPHWRASLQRDRVARHAHPAHR
jgi:glycerol kinase